MDYCKYADVFYNHSKKDHYCEDDCKCGYKKKLCFSTTPNAVLPFGKILAGAYSGYGKYSPTDNSVDNQCDNKMLVRGVSHLHNIDTDLKSYYNYAVTTPFYGDVSNITKYYEVQNEEAQPGYYKMTFNGIDCELTVTNDVAYNHYYFENKNGRIAIDFCSYGLKKEFGKEFYSFVKDAYIELTPFGEVLFSGIMSGVKMYFCACVECLNPRVTLFENTCETHQKSITPNPQNPFGAIFDFDGNSVILKLAYSLVGFDEAKGRVRAAIDSFDTAMNKAYATWGKHLSRIEIDTDDEELKAKFYSNLYHWLVKPADITDKNIMDIIGKIFLDSPHIDGAVVHLSGDKQLKIAVNNRTDTNIHLDYAEFNGKRVEVFKLSVSDLMQGGKLIFNMK